MSLRDIERAQLGWWALGAALLGVLVFVMYSFIGTIVFGLFIYYATRPIHRTLKKRVYPPSLSAAVSLFVLALPALLLVVYAFVIAVQEFQKYTDGAPIDLQFTPGAEQDVLNQIAGPEALIGIDPEQYLTADAVGSLQASVLSAADSVAELGIGLIHLFVMVALAFYLLRDDHRLSRWALAQFSDDRGVLEEFVRAVDRDFNHIFFGNILNAVLTGTISTPSSRAPSARSRIRSSTSSSPRNTASRRRRSSGCWQASRVSSPSSG